MDEEILEDELNIFISDQEIESLIYAWELQVGRSPTRTDIKNIIDDVIREEILYREALRLNLLEIELTSPCQVYRTK